MSFLLKGEISAQGLTEKMRDNVRSYSSSLEGILASYLKKKTIISSSVTNNSSM